MSANMTMDRGGMFDEEEGPPVGQPDGPPCMPPPGFTGPPPPGTYIIAAERLWKIVPPIIISIGTVGNILTVIILLRYMRKISSTAVFLLTLAISDTLFLLNAPLRRWIIVIWDKDVRYISELGCKFSVYLTYSSLQLSSWILVAVTVERFICVVWPHRVRLGCTRKSATGVVAVLILIIFGSNAHIFYGFGRSDLPIFNNQGLCEPLYEGYHTFWSKMYTWIDFAVVFLVPFVVLLVANTAIIYKLRKSQNQRRKLSIIKSAGHKNKASDTRTVTIMLICLSVVFFISLTPVSIYYIYRPYWLESIEKWQCIDIYEYIRLNELQEFVSTVTNLIGYINSAFNFVLYTISGSKYRAELKAFLLCRPGGKEGLFGSSGSGVRRQGTTSTLASISRQSSTKSTDSNGANVVNLDPAWQTKQNSIKASVGDAYDRDENMLNKKPLRLDYSEELDNNTNTESVRL
ncbi:cysteinyl leukotriene receptor 2-like [Mercenaria mercenaria]|uniref:cysteinyl leukotriene receptor 2-like n=1 Tax=Mercenaria mercenaria TaxID=6596 RepID=UPI00234EA7EE|nr:cysteinyl leukotriene receptor 2-like [Mercenaria mercenaria]